LKKKIIIRADGGTSIGMGHIVRCLALADMLKHNFTIVFAIQQPNKNVINLVNTIASTIISLDITADYTMDAINLSKHVNSNDIVVIDGYHFKTEYQKIIKSCGCKLVAIDDLHNWHHVADAIINHSAGMSKDLYSAETYTKFCIGLDYVLLRKEFLNATNPLRKIDAVKKIFISMGAADVGNITQKFTQTLLEIDGIEEIHLMLGGINPNLDSLRDLINLHPTKIKSHFDISAKELKVLLSECDIAICPASSISLESCAVGIGLISGFTASNQLGNLQGMEKLKILINFGDMNSITPYEIATRISELTQHPEQLNELLANQKKMIDGKSSERLLKLFKSL
jgi:UDP-2,4-diacetamido-2,4,6-trideoxy-beta-L-altropyranose hydrolase